MSLHVRNVWYSFAFCLPSFFFFFYAFGVYMCFFIFIFFFGDGIKSVCKLRRQFHFIVSLLMPLLHFTALLICCNIYFYSCCLHSMKCRRYFFSLLLLHFYLFVENSWIKQYFPIRFIRKRQSSYSSTWSGLFGIMQIFGLNFVYIITAT